MKAIMYHYVREYDDSYPNFRFLDILNFRKQLDFFEEQFGFVTQEEWLLFVQTGAMPGKPGKVVLTFDDSLKCHYNYVFPELLKRGLWGIFYIPTLPYLEIKILDVHKIHLLCGAFDGELLLDLALRLINTDMVPATKINEFKKQTYNYQKNYKGVTEFKKMLNYYIGYNYRTTIINQIASDIGYEFPSKSIYIPRSLLTEMHNKGMILGSHSHSHPVMSKLGLEEQFKELKTSLSFVGDITSTNISTYCHPYGGNHSFNNDTVRLLEQLNVMYSFNVEARDILASDFKLAKNFLPRYDCNLFKYGNAD